MYRTPYASETIQEAIDDDNTVEGLPKTPEFEMGIDLGCLPGCSRYVVISHFGCNIRICSFLLYIPLSGMIDGTIPERYESVFHVQDAA